jgi:hypothetical protein
VGNGVTVAYRFLGQAVDIAKVVLQITHISIRLFPGTSEAFAKPFTARVGASATFGWLLQGATGRTDADERRVSNRSR